MYISNTCIIVAAFKKNKLRILTWDKGFINSFNSGFTKKVFLNLCTETAVIVGYWFPCVKYDSCLL